MAVCSMCGRAGAWDECPRCKAPDELIERKFNKHDGGPPVSAHKQEETPGREPKPWRGWPAFTPSEDATLPGLPEQSVPLVKPPEAPKRKYTKRADPVTPA